MPIKQHRVGKALKRNRSSDIFKDGGIKISPGQVFNDPFEALVAYTLLYHRQEFEDARDRCPYYTNFEDDELVLKQQMTWFVYDRTHPTTGVRIVEEFVRENDMPEDLVKMLLQATELFHGHFKVIKKRKHDLILYDMERNKEYTVYTPTPSVYSNGCIIIGHIHPYENQYKLCGIPVICMPP